ncbi:MAG: ASCH domain-containing protein [Bifidobacterium sp.]|uniref:ASCH domain-containing protein n=1 Tax=Bifidobacterium fermentum TaxID=3059035 RepID=A0AB39UJ45_9BIFI
MSSYDISKLPKDEFAFPGPLRDKLVSALLSGKKTSSTSLLVEFEIEPEPLPKAGDLSVIIDSDERPVGVLRQSGTTICRLADVTLEHCIREGEGYESIAAWRKAHEDFWTSEEYRSSLGRPDFRLNDDTQIVCERFELVETLA